MPALNVAFWRLGGLGPKAGSKGTWVPSVSPGGTEAEMPGLAPAAGHGAARSDMPATNSSDPGQAWLTSGPKVPAGGPGRPCRQRSCAPSVEIEGAAE